MSKSVDTDELAKFFDDNKLPNLAKAVRKLEDLVPTPDTTGTTKAV